MRYRLLLACWLLLRAGICLAQQPGTKQVRIVDSLSTAEKTNRNPILLRSELDSLVRLYAPPPEQLPPQVKYVVEKNQSGLYLLVGFSAVLLLLSAVLLILLRGRQKAANREEKLPRKGEQAVSGVNGKEKNNKTKPFTASKNGQEDALLAELKDLAQENEGLNQLIKEFNGIRQDFDLLKEGMRNTYKIKNYPGNDRVKEDHLAMKGVLDTETTVANYAYEKFLKPLLSVVDANKNNPAKMNTADREKLFDLLFSLSFFYIEYLYLRVNELSIGGTMVQRIQDLAKGNGPDPSLLKKLDTDFGSRALVMRMALNKAALPHLSYPVFDETNLNHQ